jgi:2-alkyl-3-oxoalkanoate reductase
MKVFVTGATGVLGRRVVDLLVAEGATVTGLVRGPDKRAAVEAQGAAAAEVSLFDPWALGVAVAGHDVVCSLATAIPTGERSGDLAAWEPNHRIRREGSRNLVDAALAAGTRVYVQESIALLYADGGDRELDEGAEVAPTPITESSLEAERQAARFAASVERGDARAGIALRFSMFYGPDSAHTVDEIAAARRGVASELGPADAYRSSITTDDAAAAVLAALGGGGGGAGPLASGVYNVTDDEPLRRGEFVDALARSLGVGALEYPAPPALPPELSMMQRSQRVSNERFSSATGWRPRYPSAREGWAHVVAEGLGGPAGA